MSVTFRSFGQSKEQVYKSFLSQLGKYRLCLAAIFAIFHLGKVEIEHMWLLLLLIIQKKWIASTGKYFLRKL